jgi:enoyl-CoA hydratase
LNSKLTLDEPAPNVVRIKISNPAKRGALDHEILDGLAEHMRTLDARCVVITGDGPVFSAGYDLGNLEGDEFEKNAESLVAHPFTAAIEAVERYRYPVVAAINGHAIGGGLELALACDIRIAAENALFGFPEVTLGILPGLGGTQRLPRLVGPGIAKEMIFSGRRIRAEEARTVNLVNRVVPEGEALDVARELAGEIASNGPVAVRHAKAATNKAQDLDLESGLDYEADQFALLFGTEDAREGMGAFVEKREAKFKGR